MAGGYHTNVQCARLPRMVKFFQIPSNKRMILFMMTTQANSPKSETIWANPGVLGLACFGFNTLLLNVHNIGLIPNTIPLVWAFFWGGAAQIIAGIIEARRGDTFAFTAFVAYGFFWIGLGFIYYLQWQGIITVDNPSLGWTLTILFGLLAAHFLGAFPIFIAGVEGIFVGATAVYLSAAILMNTMYNRWVLPVGFFKK